MASARPKYRRVLLKLSGEAFGSGSGSGIDLSGLRRIAEPLAQMQRRGVQLAVVIGGGNIVRGGELSKTGVTPTAADTMGMLATVINGIALQDMLESMGVDTRLQTAVPMQAVAEPFIRRRAIRHLEKGRIVIFAGGTGSPHFTTDTAAALRAREIGAEALLKATNVDGVYDDDPRKNSKAKKYTCLTFQDVLRDNLRVMDATAVALCREGQLPIVVFNMDRPNGIRDAICGKAVGTRIEEK